LYSVYSFVISYWQTTSLANWNKSCNQRHRLARSRTLWTVDGVHGVQIPQP